MTSNKISLMASLTGDLPEPEQDLFGEIPLVDEPPLAAGDGDPVPSLPTTSTVPATGQLIVDNPLDDINNGTNSNNVVLAHAPHQQQQQQQQQKTAPKTKYSLANSGLLGDFSGGGGGGGGLFDVVDREEEERQKLEEQKRLEEEQKRYAEEQKQLELQRQEEARRRIHAEEQMMQSVNLASSAMLPGYPPQQQFTNHQNPMGAPYSTHQVNQVTNQMDRMGMSTPAPMTFAERSQMMQQQSAASQYIPTSTPMYQQQQQHQQQHHNQQQQPRPDSFSPAGFYRPDPLPMSPQPAPNQPQTFMYSSTGGPVQTHTISPLTTSNVSVASSSSRLPHTPIASPTVGMHNSMNRYARPPPIVQPPPFEPVYGQVTVSDPLLVQPPSLFNVVPPHWNYQIQTALKEGGFWVVRRRFRHIVALEERLRDECPGAILPPRPNKHAARALEEASTLQSAEFALQRCAEIQVFLNAAVLHPYAGKSSSLKLFLALQDDMGTAWPEVSSNALTRLGAVSGAAVQNVTESKMPWESNSQDALEDNAELLALANCEGIRMGAVTQAVPKLEGSITLLREHGESAGAVGMELNKLSKAVEASDPDLGVPIDILSQGLLRYSRRQKRLSLELSAAMNSFVTQYRMCKYEKLAFGDRRAALQRRVKERGRADMRAQRLMAHQRGYQVNGTLGELDRLERDASMSDGMALGASHQCDVIGDTLKLEVNRVAFERRTEWSKSMKVVCSSMKEATAEQKSIWEATRDSFLQAFPEYNVGP